MFKATTGVVENKLDNNKMNNDNKSVEKLKSNISKDNDPWATLLPELIAKSNPTSPLLDPPAAPPKNPINTGSPTPKIKISRQSTCKINFISI